MVTTLTHVTASQVTLATIVRNQTTASLATTVAMEPSVLMEKIVTHAVSPL